MKAVWITPKDDLEIRPEGLYSRLASARYRAIVPAVALASRGHHASVVGLDAESSDSVYDHISDADVVVLRKHYADPACAEQMLARINKRQIKTFFDLSDDRFTEYGPHLRFMLQQAGGIVTASVALQEIVQRQVGRHSNVVSDPFEGARGEARGFSGGRMSGLWFGHGFNLPSLLQSLPELLRAAVVNPFDLTIVTERLEGLERYCEKFNHKNRDSLCLRFSEWSMQATASALNAADFVVIPALPDKQWTLAKSPNRIIESLWAGRFVIAHPIPAYMEFNAWAHIGPSLAEGIAWMVGNGGRIVGHIEGAQNFIANKFSPERISLEWEKVFEEA